MVDASAFESKYYFDVSENQWWVLSRGKSEWSRLSFEAARSLGLHEAVLSEECTFVESTVGDYKAALCTGSSLREPVSSHASDVDDDAVPPESLPSIQYGKSLSSQSSILPSSRSRLSNSDSFSKEESLQVRFSNESIVYSPANTGAFDGPDLAARSVSAPDCTNMESSSSVVSGFDRQGTSGSAIFKDEFNKLTNETSGVISTSDGESAPSTLTKVESFVRTAVRHATMKDGTGFGDCIRAVAVERERMQKLGNSSGAGERYEKMLDRARTLAAISQEGEGEARRERSIDERRQTFMRDLRMEVMGDGGAVSATVDVSSGSDDDTELSKSDSLKNLMSQRMSLRRGCTLKMSRSRRRQLGLSVREYEESVILERMFQLAQRHRCATCLVRKPTHVDQEREELLCESCARRVPYKVRIGHDHISRVLLDRLESAYDHRSSRNRISGHKSDKKKHGSHRLKHSPSSSDRFASARHTEIHHRRVPSSSKRRQSLDSVSTEESVARDTRRSGWPGHHRSFSSSSSVAGRVRSPGVPHVDEDLFSGGRQSHYRMDARDLRYGGRDAVCRRNASRPDYVTDYQPPYSRGHSENMAPHRPHRDPYGYDMPLVDDMPGMKGSMIPRRPALRDPPNHWDRGNRIPHNGPPGPGYSVLPVDPRKGGAGVSRVDNPVGAVSSKEYISGVREQDVGYEQPGCPLPRLAVGSNPFSTGYGRDRVSGRFDLSSMRLALPSVDVLPSSGVGCDVMPSVTASYRGVAAYGGLYDRRARH
ncbi:uncharacterized protein BXIN_0561 [Babesia sp. Xinjiang]|uniref:uncharacterized protein n=1 Tax=Babesia sp. Xinjiang TaxID=462227 RepID=UPI000A249D75|nr:uncharacterized protein BXIN_0561 [Babesia sp. Xinjiang]ORM41858.1 hypothetical protein BXIN_0561 [Babesia sp. Xinjiang]